MTRLALTAALALAATPAAPCTDRALLILDASGSMMETDPGSHAPRQERAARALSLALPGATDTRAIGLMVYGPGGHDACSGIALKVEPHKDSAAEILGHVHAAEPGGLTPIQAALEMAAVAMDYQGDCIFDKPMRTTYILIKAIGVHHVRSEQAIHARRSRSVCARRKHHLARWSGLPALRCGG